MGILVRRANDDRRSRGTASVWGDLVMKNDSALFFAIAVLALTIIINRWSIDQLETDIRELKERPCVEQVKWTSSWYACYAASHGCLV